MFITRRRWLNPLMWTVIGWSAGALGELWIQVFSTRLRVGPLLAHFLANLGIGLFIGGMRWIQQEYRVKRVYWRKKSEMKMRDMLMILAYSPDVELKRKTLDRVTKILFAPREDFNDDEPSNL